MITGASGAGLVWEVVVKILDKSRVIGAGPSPGRDMEYGGGGEDGIGSDMWCNSDEDGECWSINGGVGKGRRLEVSVDED